MERANLESRAMSLSLKVISRIVEDTNLWINNGTDVALEDWTHRLFRIDEMLEESLEK